MIESKQWRHQQQKQLRSDVFVRLPHKFQAWASVVRHTMESSGQEECRTPVMEYRSTGAGSGKNLTRTGTTLLSIDIDRSTEHQYMDTPTDRTHPDPATEKNWTKIWRQRRKNWWCRKALTTTEDGMKSNKAAWDTPSNGTSAPWCKRIVRLHQRSENCEMAENVRKSLKDDWIAWTTTSLRNYALCKPKIDGRADGWRKIRTRRIRSRRRWKNGRVRRPPAPGGRNKRRRKRRAGSVGKAKPKGNDGLN